MKEEFQAEIAKQMAGFKQAANWMRAYEILCHMVDDLIDRDKNGMDYTLLTLDAFSLAADVYSAPFYQQNCTWLYPLCKSLHRVWSASIAWEHDATPWKAHYADVLRCCGSEMTMAVLEHVCHLPQSELRRIDAMMREAGWELHHDKEGNPI
jgi:hypothetical protein